MKSGKALSGVATGVYVYDGFMVIVNRHHKAKRSTNREFNVVWFLSARGGQIAFRYLVYILPSLEMLNREQSRYFVHSIVKDYEGG